MWFASTKWIIPHRRDYSGRAYVLRFMDGLTTTTLAFALPLMIYNATHSVAWSGTAFLVEWLPRILSIPLAGPWVDRFGSKRIFMLADSARALVLIFALLSTVVYPQIWPVLLGITVLSGMLAQVSFVAAEHLGVHIITSKPSHRVQSMQVNIDQAVLVLGPMVGGILLIGGNKLVFLATLVLSVLSVVLAGRVRRIKESGNTRDQTSIWEGLQQGAEVIKNNPALMHVVAGTAIFNLLLAFITVLSPFMIKGQFGGSDVQVSLLWMIGAIGSIVAVSVANRIIARWGIVVVGCISGVLASLAVCVAGFADSYVGFVVFAGLFMAMDGVYAVYIRTARARIVPLEDFGVTVGVIVLLSIIPFPLVGGLVAIMPAKLLPYCMVACAAACCLSAIFSYLRIDQQALSQAE
jgi:MFS family permease